MIQFQLSPGSIISDIARFFVAKIARECYLDHDNCLEVIIVRGKAAMVKKLADELIAAKGVKHGKLTITSIGKDLPL